MTARLVVLCVVVLALPLAAPASHASMVLSNVILHFEPGKPTRQDIEVENVGDEPMYVQVKPQRVLDAGTVTERRETIRDPRAAGLLVTPNKLVIAPHSRKMVRFVDLEPGGSAERVYRVAVTPVVGELAAQQTGIKILIGYEVLVLAQPGQPMPDLVATRDGHSLNFENRGNTNVLLREGRQCPDDTAPVDDCTVLPSKRLYPGNSWSVDLPYDRPVEYFLSTGTKNTAQVYP